MINALYDIESPIFPLQQVILHSNGIFSIATEYDEKSH